MEKGRGGHQTDTDTTDNNLSTARENDGGGPCLEELAAGVSLGGRQSERQEWSFTLYDLDGQGRVTKDEVAQLLKSLYDAVGSSISLPEAGTKSLKLLLTVSPDKTRAAGSDADDAELRSPVGTGCTGQTRDLNCKECNSDKDKMHCAKKDINSRLNNDLCAANAATSTPAKEQHLLKTNCCGSSSPDKKLQFHSPLRVNLQNNLSKAAQRDQGHDTGTNKMSVLEQRQLAELVQFNMDQNRKKKSRRHSEGGQAHHTERKHRTLHLSHILENPDRRSYYLDLAGIDSSPPPCTSSSFAARVSHEYNRDAEDCIPLLKPKLRTKSRGSAHRRSHEKTKSQGYALVKDHHNHHRSSPGDSPNRPNKTADERDKVSKTTTAPDSKTPHADATTNAVSNRCTASQLSPGTPRQESGRNSQGKTKTTAVQGSTTSPSHHTRHNKRPGRSPHKHFSPKLTANVATCSSPTSPTAKDTKTCSKTEGIKETDVKDPVPVVQLTGTTMGVERSELPKYRRHKHQREKNHVRAMMQVAHWIEREQHVNTSDILGDVSIERHEHHHFHEHHHHHHYHYHQTT